MEKRDKVLAAKLLEKVARKSVQAAVDSRCMYVLHQPKQPENIRKFEK
ncbi:MAG: cyclic lactone autoinducer peptide [Roseburia sp.]